MWEPPLKPKPDVWEPDAEGPPGGSEVQEPQPSPSRLSLPRPPPSFLPGETAPVGGGPRRTGSSGSTLDRCRSPGAADGVPSRCVCASPVRWGGAPPPTRGAEAAGRALEHRGALRKRGRYAVTSDGGQATPLSTNTGVSNAANQGACPSGAAKCRGHMRPWAVHTGPVRKPGGWACICLSASSRGTGQTAGPEGSWEGEG